MARGTNGYAGRLALGAGAFVLALGLPSAVYAVGEMADGGSASIVGSFASFTPASVDPQLAAILSERSGISGRMMRFTPAGSNEGGAARSVTVAVRLGAQSAQAISGRGALDGDAAGTASSLRIASSRYNLGLARGYRSFAQAPALSSALSTAEIPDLAEFRPSPGAADVPSRFAARVELDETRSAARTADQSASIGDQLLDVGGSYRLTRNIDVTAGVRYQQDRDLRPLPDLEKQDSQAVYIGTQFRF